MQLGNKSDMEDSQTKFIAKIANDASRDAIKNAFRHGRSVTGLQGEHIVKKYPDGSIEVIRKVENSIKLLI